MSEQYIVLTPPAVEPVTLSETKAWLRVDFPDDDVVIAYLISRARSLCETITGRAFAPQKIQEVYTITRPEGGEISGPIMRGPNWYQYQEMIGANPFGAAMFYFDMAMPPFDTTQPLVMETRVTAFDTWKTFTQFTNPDGSTNTYVDNVAEPARLYVQDPLTVNFWRFTYFVGYGPNTYPLPFDLKQALMETISYLYDYREAEDLPDALKAKLLSKRIAHAWI